MCAPKVASVNDPSGSGATMRAYFHRPVLASHVEVSTQNPSFETPAGSTTRPEISVGPAAVAAAGSPAARRAARAIATTRVLLLMRDMTERTATSAAGVRPLRTPGAILQQSPGSAPACPH